MIKLDWNFSALFMHLNCKIGFNYYLLCILLSNSTVMISIKCCNVIIKQIKYHKFPLILRLNSRFLPLKNPFHKQVFAHFHGQLILCWSYCWQKCHSFFIAWLPSLHWRHNDHDGVSNHQLHDCLLNRLYRRRSKKTSKLRVTGLCVGNSPGPVNSPHKGRVMRKMFPYHVKKW